MSRFATLLGKDSDALEYNALAAGIRRAYNNRFYNYLTHGYSNNTVTANVLSLYNGLTPDGETEALMENIVRTVRDRHQGHVCCGVIGMQYLMRTLSRNGYQDMAFSMATQTSYPSWGYMLDNGATTIWELWNGNTAAPQMNSGNHVMLLGDLIIWMYEDLAGISPDSDGYRHLTMKPVFPTDLTYIEASYEAVSGQIESRWQRRSTDKTNNDYNVIDWQITLPKGVSATVVLPDGSRQEIKGHQKLTFTK